MKASGDATAICTLLKQPHVAQALMTRFARVQRKMIAFRSNKAVARDLRVNNAI